MIENVSFELCLYACVSHVYSVFLLCKYVCVYTCVCACSLLLSVYAMFPLHFWYRCYFVLLKTHGSGACVNQSVITRSRGKGFW